MENESWPKSGVKQTFPVLFISQTGLIKEFPVEWKQLQGTLLITKNHQPIKKPQPPPKNIQQPLPQKKPKPSKNTNLQSQPSYKAFSPISFSVTS